MLLPGENSPKSWLFVTILMSTIIVFSESSGGKRLDIKLGFDITQGAEGGAPSLRIRDFEDSHDYNPRAMDGESSNDESASEKNIEKLSSEEPKKGDSSKERVKPDKSDDDDADEDDKNSASGDDNTVRVTRGPKTIDFEPEEENPKIHGKYQKDSISDNNSDEDGRRYKRNINRYGNVVKSK